MATPARPQPDAIIASEWGAWVHDSVVYRCTSADRPSNPQVGTTIYETDSQSLKVYSGSRVGWTPPWLSPWGILTSTVTDKGQTGITTPTDVTGSEVSAIFTPNRWYRVTFTATFLKNDVRERVLLLLNVAGANIASTQADIGVNERGTLTGVHLYSTAQLTNPTTQVVKLQAQSVGGSVTLDLGPTQPAMLVVEDIGPSRQAT